MFSIGRFMRIHRFECGKYSILQFTLGDLILHGTSKYTGLQIQANDKETLHKHCPARPEDRHEYFLFLCFAQNRAADGAGVMLVSAAGIDVDSIEPDVSPIQDAKTRSDHPPINFDAGDDGFFGMALNMEGTIRRSVGLVVPFNRNNEVIHSSVMRSCS